MSGIQEKQLHHIPRTWWAAGNTSKFCLKLAGLGSNALRLQSCVSRWYSLGRFRKIPDSASNERCRLWESPPGMWNSVTFAPLAYDAPLHQQGAAVPSASSARPPGDAHWTPIPTRGRGSPRRGPGSDTYLVKARSALQQQRVCTRN